MGFVNMFPTTAPGYGPGPPGYPAECNPGGKTGNTQNFTCYTAYLELFVRLVKPQVLCFDYYTGFSVRAPLNASSGTIYHKNLAIYRNASLKHNIPFWNYCECMLAAHLP